MHATSPSFSPALRRLHFFVAILVTVQIIIGLVMGHDTPNLFLSHQLIGLTIAALVILHWLWLFTGERDQLRHLVPLAGDARRAVGADIAGLRRGDVPEGGPRAGLPALIHGLGLLALTAVALLGTSIYILIRLHHARSTAGEVLGDLHSFFAWVLIVYWCGHVLLAAVHEARGDHVIARMFRLRRAPTATPPATD